MSDERAKAMINLRPDACYQPRERPPFELRLLAVLVAAAFGQPQTGWALPDGAQVIAGSATVSRPSSQSMLIQQGTPRAIINWQGFSIGSPESVVFQQPAASSAVLNRVTGAQRSEIHGAMSANGQVFLVNPNGVLFGRGASIDVGGLVASTLDIGNQDFLDGRYRFAGSGGAGAVTNSGNLRAADGGTVALLGGQIHNDGTVDVKLGHAVLAAGNRVTLDFAGDGLTKVTVDEAVLGAQVRNSGAIIVDGGQAVMTARAADEVVRTVVNQSGVVRATSLVEREGRIVLDGGDRGGTQLSGTLDVSGRAAGASGGQVHVLGREVELATGAFVDASGHRGGGTVLVGGDFQGRNPAIANAKVAAMASEASIVADAHDAGPGGRVILWSDDSTRAHGTIDATGGPNGGNGGFVETSGKRLDVSGARVDAGSPRGDPGTWLLDPVASIIDNAMATAISTSLATTDVDVTTDPEGDPDITVAASIEKTGGPGTRTKLSLRAERHVTVEEDVQITSASGPLDVELIARRDANDLGIPGRVSLGSGARIITNGGNVLISGGVNPLDPDNGRAVGVSESESYEDSVGISLDSAEIDSSAGTAAGSIVLRGLGGSFISDGFHVGTGGVALIDSVLAGGQLTIDGMGGSGDDGGGGVEIRSSTVGAQTSVSIHGVGGNGNGTSFSESFSEAGSGVWLDDSWEGGPTEVSGGSVSISGIGGGSAGGEVSGGVGVSIAVATVRAAGVVTIRGEARLEAPAVAIESSWFPTIIESTASNGAVRIFGAGRFIDEEPTGTIPGIGLSIRGGTDTVTVRANEGEIALGGEGFRGVRVGSGTRIENAGPASGTIGIMGRAWLPSEGVGSALLIEDGVTIEAVGSRGTITLGATGSALGDLLDVSRPTFRTNGPIIVAPMSFSSDGRGNITHFVLPIDLGGALRPGVPFHLSTPELSNLSSGASAVVVGSPLHIGTITLRQALNLQRDPTLPCPPACPRNLTLQQSTGTLGGGIVIDAPVSIDGTLALISGGPITQTQPVSATNLLLSSGTGALAFDNPSNSVGTLTMNAGGGTASFVNAGPLTLGTVAAARAHQLPGSPVESDVITQSQSGSAGSFFAQTLAGNLELQHNVTTQSGEITLASANVFRNTGNATLSPGGSRWIIWANTWDAGEGGSEQRGGLTPGAPLPNLYTGCAFGNTDCEGASGVTIPATGNHFVYSERPILEFTAADASRSYGDANPAFPVTLVSGLRSDLGDTLADAIEGSFSTSVGPATNVGVYPVEGNFVSPSGYILVSPDGENSVSLTITPAMLTFLADRASREYGLENPPLSGTVSGFRNGETASTATTGALSFATSATATSNVGSYPIEGGGLVADNGNYTFAQAPSNATALTIGPAPLTYVADPGSRSVGTANPPFGGTVSGFRVGDTQAGATTGTLRFESPATASSPAGSYAIEGSGLTASNYVFQQAPANSVALSVLPGPDVPEPPRPPDVRLRLADLGLQPILGNPRNPETEPAYVYDRNFGLPGMCIPSGSLATSSGPATGDLLEIEWARVRSRPNLTNCVSVGDRDFCSDL